MRCNELNIKISYNFCMNFQQAEFLKSNKDNICLQNLNAIQEELNVLSEAAKEKHFSSSSQNLTNITTTCKSYCSR